MDERTRDVSISAERARSILNYLSRFAYATRQHLFFGLAWTTGMRLGSARAIDVSDVCYDETGRMYVQLRHRPETETPLKLGAKGERAVTVGSDPLAEAIDDWIQHRRPKVTEEYGRTPLLATDQGRASKTTLRVACYQATQPCLLDDCPHDEDPSTCEYRSHNRAGGCPSAVSPHAIRRSAITTHLDSGMPKELVSERCNVSPDTLDEHYDARTEDQRRELRSKYVDEMRF
jgi:integrase